MTKQFMTAAELIKQCEADDQARDSRITFCKDGVTLDGHYFIAKDRINSETKLLQWTVHLMEKSWLDMEMLRYFVCRVAEKYKIKIYGAI